MNQNIKYIIEGLLDDFYDDTQIDIIDDFLVINIILKIKKN